MSEYADYKGIPLPVVHLNGTSRRELIDRYQSAMDHLNNALEAMAGLYHPRDYYPLGDGPTQKARIARDAVVSNIHQARDYALFHFHHLQTTR